MDGSVGVEGSHLFRFGNEIVHEIVHRFPLPGRVVTNAAAGDGAVMAAGAPLA